MTFSKKLKPVKLKICGLTCPEDVRYCNSIGVDSIGLLVYDSGEKHDPMNITSDEASQIVLEIKNDLRNNSNSTLESVLLVKKKTHSEIIDTIRKISPDAVQMQKETHDVISLHEIRSEFKNIKIIKTIYVDDSIDIVETCNYIDKNVDYIDAVLLDSKKGGSGQTHNWDISANIASHIKDKELEVILAGGLNPDNLKIAIDTISPDMVDIMSYAKDTDNESRKDHKRIDSLVKIIKCYNNEVQN